MFGVDVLATLFCLFGWLDGGSITPNGYGGDHWGWTDIVTVVKIWGYSFGVVIICLLVCKSSTQ